MSANSVARECTAKTLNQRRGRPRGLNALFHPHAIAVVGASLDADSVGRLVVSNLAVRGGARPLQVIHPSLVQIEHVPCIASLDLLGAGTAPDIDLVIICVPAPCILGVLHQCAAGSVSAALILASSTTDCQAMSAEERAAISGFATAQGIALLGPNGLGIMHPQLCLNASIAPPGPAGNIAFLSQSRSMGLAILDWSRRTSAGLRSLVASDVMGDLDWSDLIDLAGEDPGTTAVMAYLETIGDARQFLSSAREVARRITVIVLKPRQHDVPGEDGEGHAATRHEEALDAAFAAAGVIRVEDVGEFFALAQLLRSPTRPLGRRMAIVTNGHGPGLIAAAALADAGLSLAHFDAATIGALAGTAKDVRPGAPIVLGSANVVHSYDAALQVLTSDGTVDGVLAIIVPEVVLDVGDLARGIKMRASLTAKPILTCWMSGSELDQARIILSSCQVPAYRHPEEALHAFGRLVNAQEQSDASAATSVAGIRLADFAQCSARAARLMERRQVGTCNLGLADGTELLQCYGITALRGVIATNERDVIEAAERIGFPVALSCVSLRALGSPFSCRHILLRTREEVRHGYHNLRSRQNSDHDPPVLAVEVHAAFVDNAPIVRVTTWCDSCLGPVLKLEWDGALRSLVPHYGVALPPLSAGGSEQVTAKLCIPTSIATHFPSLGRELGELLQRLSHLLCTQPGIRSMRLDSVHLGGGRALVENAIIELHGADVNPPRLAIRPCPHQYSESLLVDRVAVGISPLQPCDEPALLRFHAGLSDRSVRMRYFHTMELTARTSHTRLSQLCHADYDRECALIATIAGEHGDDIVAVGRLSREQHETTSGELALVVSDAWQGRGLGHSMVTRLLAVAPLEGYRRLTAAVLPDNGAMRHLLGESGFTFVHDLQEGTCIGTWNSPSKPGIHSPIV